MSNERSEKLYGRRLDVHHLDGDLLNNSEDNLVTLCRDCHAKLHSNQIITVPIIVLFLAFEKYLEQGLVAGGVKG